VTPNRFGRSPQTAINAEQTASPFSIMMYAFLDQMVFLASRVLHLSHDMLPPLADYDYTKNIVQKSFEHLDPLSGSHRSISFGFNDYLSPGILPNGNSCHHQGHIIASRAGWNE